MAFTEIPIDRFSEYAPLFPGPQLALLLQSVAAGNTVARLWITGGVGRPDLAVLWDFGNKGIYISGTPSSTHSPATLRSFVVEDLTAVARTTGLKYLSVRTLLPELVGTVNDAFGDAITKSHTKLFHEHPAAPRAETITTPADVQFVNIDRNLLESGMVNSEQVMTEVKWMWPSVDRFLAHGFGIAAIAGDQVVCWCTAEYVGPSQCGIGIETVDAYQNQGIATAVASRFIDESLRRGKNPCWECGSDNIRSIRVAGKLGFRLTESSDWRVGRW